MYKRNYSFRMYIIEDIFEILFALCAVNIPARFLMNTFPTAVFDLAIRFRINTITGFGLREIIKCTFLLP